MTYFGLSFGVYVRLGGLVPKGYVLSVIRVWPMRRVTKLLSVEVVLGLREWKLRFIWHPTVSEYGTKPFYGGGRARIETHPWQMQKYLTPSHSSFGKPLAPSNKFSSASRQRPERTVPWNQSLIVRKLPLGMNVRWPARCRMWGVVYMLLIGAQAQL